MHLSKEVLEKILSAVTDRAHSLFDNQCHIKVEDVILNDIVKNKEFVDLICFESMNEKLDLLFTMKYEDSLIDALVQVLNFSNIEDRDLKFDALKEIANIIFGSSIQDFPKEFEDTVLSIGYIKSFKVDKGITILKSTIKTKKGFCYFYLFYPKSILKGNI